MHLVAAYPTCDAGCDNPASQCRHSALVCSAPCVAAYSTWDATCNSPGSQCRLSALVCSALVCSALMYSARLQSTAQFRLEYMNAISAFVTDDRMPLHFYTHHAHALLMSASALVLLPVVNTDQCMIILANVYSYVKLYVFFSESRTEPLPLETVQSRFQSISCDPSAL